MLFSATEQPLILTWIIRWVDPPTKPPQTELGAVIGGVIGACIIVIVILSLVWWKKDKGRTAETEFYRLKESLMTKKKIPTLPLFSSFMVQQFCSALTSNFSSSMQKDSPNLLILY